MDSIRNLNFYLNIKKTLTDSERDLQKAAKLC